MSRYYFLKQGRSLQRITVEGDPPRKVDELNIGPIEADCKVNVSYNFPVLALLPCYAMSSQQGIFLLFVRRIFV
jgi:hypothetical protein